MTSPFLDLASWLTHLESAGRLRRVAAEVDKDTELACMARWSMEGHRGESAYALRFDKVRGHPHPVVVNIYPTHALYAEALGTTEDRVLEHWAQAVANPFPCVTVDRAPVHDLIEQTPRANLLGIPAPVWTPGRDAGPYLSAAMVITKDPETGVQNLACYRIQIHDETHAGLFFGSRLQHGALHYAKWRKLGQPMPVALVIGAAPAINFAAAAKTAYGIDEMTIAGSLAGAPIELVRGKTVDLLVPAGADYVIEGTVPLDAERMEGPFGEALGYMNQALPAAVIDVTAICRRKDAVHHGYVQQLPPSDGHIVMEMGVLGPLWFYLNKKLRVPGLRDIAIASGSAGVATLIVQLERTPGRDVPAVGRALAKLKFGQKFIYLVDDDVDIRDPETVNWAVSSRVDPHRDITLIDATPTFQYDPSVLARAYQDGAALSPPPYSSSLAVIDATIKCAVPEISLPSPAAMKNALKRCKESGLPPLAPRRRIARLLESHGDSGIMDERSKTVERRRA